MHDYYKCNDINHEKFYKCQYVRDPNSGASICSHSWFLLIPAFKLIFDPGARLFKLWSVTKVSNNWATLFCTKLVWSQNWFKIGSFETENDDGQCVNSRDNLNSEENILFFWFSRFTSILLSNEISISQKYLLWLWI